MIDHVSLAVRDLVASAWAYERMLTPLGLVRLVERSGAVGFGKRYPELWLNHRPRQIAIPPDTGAHVCLRAPDEEAVRAFHAAALAGHAKTLARPGRAKRQLRCILVPSSSTQMATRSRRLAFHAIPRKALKRPLRSLGTKCRCFIHVVSNLT